MWQSLPPGEELVAPRELRGSYNITRTFLTREWQKCLPRKPLSMYMHQRSITALKQNMTPCMPLVYHHWYTDTPSLKAQMAGTHIREVTPCSSALGRQPQMGSEALKTPHRL